MHCSWQDLFEQCQSCHCWRDVDVRTINDMTVTVVFLILLALIVVAIERNYTRQRYHGPTLAGSDTATDRDAERVTADLKSAHEDIPGRAARARAIVVGRPVAR